MKVYPSLPLGAATRFIPLPFVMPLFLAVFQGARLVWCLGVFRRIQPDRRRSTVGGRTTDPMRDPGGARRPRAVRFRRHGTPSEPCVLRVHHHEPWIRRQVRTARQLKGTSPLPTVPCVFNEVFSPSLHTRLTGSKVDKMFLKNALGHSLRSI